MNYDVCFLEDNADYKIFFRSLIPKYIAYVILKDGRDLQEYLNRGDDARLYFLDDHVQDKEGKVDFHFIKHCSQLLEERPCARILYIGSTPGKKEREYCSENSVEIVEREEFLGVIKREFSK